MTQAKCIRSSLLSSPRFYEQWLDVLFRPNTVSQRAEKTPLPDMQHGWTPCLCPLVVVIHIPGSLVSAGCRASTSSEG